MASVRAKGSWRVAAFAAIIALFVVACGSNEPPKQAPPDDTKALWALTRELAGLPATPIAEADADAFWAASAVSDELPPAVTTALGAGGAPVALAPIRATGRVFTMGATTVNLYAQSLQAGPFDSVGLIRYAALGGGVRVDWAELYVPPEAERSAADSLHAAFPNGLYDFLVFDPTSRRISTMTPEEFANSYVPSPPAPPAIGPDGFCKGVQGTCNLTMSIAGELTKKEACGGVAIRSGFAVCGILGFTLVGASCIAVAATVSYFACDAATNVLKGVVADGICSLLANCLGDHPPECMCPLDSLCGGVGQVTASACTALLSWGICSLVDKGGKIAVLSPHEAIQKTAETILGATCDTFSAAGFEKTCEDEAQRLCPTDAGPVLPAHPGKGGYGNGDPHLLTFDGERYDCQVWGETTLCRSPGGDLEVQMRTHQLNAENVAVIRGVAANVQGDHVAIYVDGGTTENGDAATFPAGRTSLGGGGEVWNTGGGYVIRWHDNSQLYVEILNGSSMNVAMYIADVRKGAVTGLLGNGNDDPADDLAPSDGGAPLKSPAAFADFYGGYVNGWRVTGATTLFDYAAGESTASPDITNLAFPAQLETAASLDPGVAGSSAAVCQAAGVAPEWGPSCQLDVALIDARAADTFVDLPPGLASFDVDQTFGGPPEIVSVLPDLITPGNAITISGAHLTTLAGGTDEVRVDLSGTAGGVDATVSLAIVSATPAELTVMTSTDLYGRIAGPATLVVRTPEADDGGVSAPVTVLAGDAFGDPDDAGTDGVFGAAYKLQTGTSKLPAFGSVASLTAPCADPSVVTADAGFPCPLSTFEMPNVYVPYAPTLPAPGYPSVTEHFAVRLRARLTVTTPGAYHFQVCSNDGSIVYLFDPAILDGGAPADAGAGGLPAPIINLDGPQNNQCSQVSQGNVTLAAGVYALVVDYYQGYGPGAELSLSWTVPGGSSAVIPPSQLQAWIP